MHSIPKQLHMRVDALAILGTGLGEPERYAQAFADWNDPGSAARFCFVTGAYQAEHQAFIQTPDSLSERFGFIRRDGLFVQPEADHTLHQAEWTREQVQNTGATSVAVYAPHYHLLRAWLTFVQSIVVKANITIPVIPVQVDVSPFSVLSQFAEDGILRHQLIAGEFDRARQYTQKGNVADFPEVFKYMKWLWKNL